jgi:hypothetical protein
VYHAPLSRLVALDYQRSREKTGPVAFLDGYKGALQSDGYPAYDGLDRFSVQSRWPDITSYGCWTHARRYFRRSSIAE